MSHKFLLKIIALGFLLHFIQLSYVAGWFYSHQGDGPFAIGPEPSYLIFVFGGASLITGILLWTIPKLGIIIAILRSIIGIYFAVESGHFLKFEVLFSLTQESLAIWPSLFFLITITLLTYVTFTGKVYTK